MSLKQKTSIKNAVKVREFVPGTVMIPEGKYNNAAYIIIEGEARMEKSIKPHLLPKKDVGRHSSQRILGERASGAKALKIGLKTEN